MLIVPPSPPPPPPPRSPGYGMTLVSESTTGVLHSAELFSHNPPSREGAEQPHPHALPEDIGRKTALLLIQEIVKVQVQYGSVYL